MVFFIAFNLVSKLRSCPVTPTGMARAGIILTMPNAEEITVIAIAEEQIRVARVLPITVVIETVAYYS